MQFEDAATGEWHVVTNSVPFGRVRCARQLRLAPRGRLPEAGAARRSRGRRSQGSGRGRGSPSKHGRGSDDDDDLAGGARRAGSASRLALLKGPQDGDAAATLD